MNKAVYNETILEYFYFFLKLIQASMRFQKGFRKTRYSVKSTLKH